MDHRRLLLDARVAEAAEAWLADPRDANVYARLVAAIEERRRHLDAAPDAVRPLAASPPPAEPDDAQPVAEAHGTDEPSEELDEARAATIRPVGEALLGDPRVALERLRRGQASG